MTAYIITPEEHAMLVDALTQWTTPNWAGSGVDQCNAALSMLKAMTPVEPTCYGWRGNDGAVRDCIAPDTHQIIEGQYNVPLYAKEQQ